MSNFASLAYNKDLFLTARFKRILSDLYNDIQNQKSLIMLLGEKGVGKTTLLWHLKDVLLNEKYLVSYLSHSVSSVDEALNKICSDFGFEIEASQNSNVKLRDLSYLTSVYREQGNICLIIVDDLLLFKQEILDGLKTIFETANTNRTNLQFILAEDYTIFQEIEKPHLQFIQSYLESVHYVYPLNKSELQEYLFYKLGFINAKADKIPFVYSRVVRKTWSATKGNFYLISLLAEQIEKSMQRQDKAHLSGKIIKQTLKDTYRNQPEIFQHSPKNKNKEISFVFLGIFGLIILLGIFFLYPSIFNSQYYKSEKKSSLPTVKRSISFNPSREGKKLNSNSNKTAGKDSRELSSTRQKNYTQAKTSTSSAGKMSELSFIPPSKIKVANSTKNNNLYAVIVGAALEKEAAKDMSRYLKKNDIDSCLLELTSKNGKKLFIVEIGLTKSKKSAQNIASSYTQKMHLEPTLRLLDKRIIREYMHCP